MGVTSSQAQNITSPSGNSLAVFIDGVTGIMMLKDINGRTEPLSNYVCGGGGGGTSPFEYNANATGIQPILGSNNASGYFGTIGGGRYNTASFAHSKIGGGILNTASGYCTTVGGGNSNTSSYFFATTGGGLDNISSGYGATVSGGVDNISSGCNSAIGGGKCNSASNCYTTVGGGCCSSKPSGVLEPLPLQPAAAAVAGE